MQFLPLSRAIKVGLSGLALALVTTPAEAATYITTVIASGLNSPRDLAFGPDGALYVAESGFIDPATVPASTYTFLNNGSITRIAGGSQARIVSGLPSVFSTTTNEISGPQGLAFDADTNTGYLLFGLGADPAVRPTGSLLGHVVSLSLDGTFTDYDVSAFEGLYNPLGGAIDSNPFHIATGAGGVFVTDAAANTLYSLTPGGAVELDASFPARFIGPPVPESESVPTGIAVAPDGTRYVSELTGFPFTPGAAQIYTLAAGSSTPNVFATGFTNLTDIAFGPDGSLYALSYDLDSLLGPDVSGGIFRVSSTGAVQSIATGLVNPAGLTVDSKGDIYVASIGNGLEGSGQVLKVSAVPEPATWGMMLMGFGAIGFVARRRRPARAAALA